MIEGDFKILHSAKVKPGFASVDGDRIELSDSDNFLTRLYHFLNMDYPKFHKMDTLSKVGFLTSELVLNAEGAERFVPRSDRAVILFNRSSSVCTDRQFYKGIEDPGQFYPKPSLFVYTLPNIVTGEIAIRNKYMAETSIYVLDSRSQRIIAETVERAFLDLDTKSVFTGWIDVPTETDYESEFYIIEK